MRRIAKRTQDNAFWMGAGAVALYFICLSVLAGLGVFEGTEARAEESLSGAERIEEPTAILIPEIGVESVVLNPTSTDVSVLDSALLSGAVRYPKSARLGENANMLLFAHSTTYRVVRNEAYKTFNRISQLGDGSYIYVRSLSREYLYRVRDVRLVSAETALIEFKTGERILTLTTCNTFGKKEERHVVTSEYVRSYPLVSG